MQRQREKAIIIGAGVAGLSAGCHLRASGYHTEILEAHSLPGGLCTAWRRGEFLFDGCIHWMPGMSRASALYEINDEVLDLAGIEVVRHETILNVETLNSAAPGGERMFHLYGNIDRLESYLRRIAPEDGALIDELVGICRFLSECRLPPTLDPPELLGWRGKLGMLRLLPLVLKMKRIGGRTLRDFAARARNPFLKEALERLTLGKDYPAVIVLMQVAFAHQGSSATPLGGSLAFARRIESRYLGLGGAISYNSRVARIRERAGRACGVELVDGSVREADLVVSAADGHFTLFEALGGRHLTPALRELYALNKLEPFESLVYVSLGLGAAFAGQPPSRIFAFAEPRTLCDGSQHSWIQAHLVNFDPAQAPAGKSVVNVMLLTRQHEFWIKLRASDHTRYQAEKERALQFVLDALEEKMGGVKAALETSDVATPATFVRFTGNWMGSYEGWYPDKNFLAANSLPKSLPTLRDFYMIGQWSEPGGGITPCIKSGRDVARIICLEDGREWVAPSR